MALFSSPRLARLFEMIQAEQLPQNELAKRFNVSSRTIRTDISELNDILHRYGAQIFYKRGSGYILHVDDQTLFATLPKQRKAIQTIPRTARDRTDTLLLKLLLEPDPIKLDNIAEAWCISRGTLQHDMSTVRERLGKYALQLESIPRFGTKLNGDERLIRACLTDILLHRFLQEMELPLDQIKIDTLAHIDLIHIDLPHIDLLHIEETLQNNLNRFDIQLTNTGRQYLIFNCAASLLRIRRHHMIGLNPIAQEPITQESITQGSITHNKKLQLDKFQLDKTIQKVAEEISASFTRFVENGIPPTEIHYLGRQIAVQRIPQHGDSVFSILESQRWADDILNDINESYNYDLRHDNRLRNDLAMHLSLLISRLQHQISTQNPLLADIKHYYPFAYDVTVSALTRIGDQLPYIINEDELGYLAVHIGVGLERHYGTGNNRPIPVLLVTDAGNAIQRMIEAQITREFSQLKLQRILPCHEYNKLAYVEENFVITTLRLTEKNKPVVKISPFPTPYQLELIGRLTMVDQTRSSILERFFDRRYFIVIKEEITQEALFKKVCRKLQADGYVNDDFLPSLIERESILSTLFRKNTLGKNTLGGNMPGENIALPHSLGLLALKTVVVTILAPNGIEWSKETKERANVIFLLAISKEDYEEAMSIYDLFVTFVREKAVKRLLRSRNFDDFQVIAKDSLGRVI
ncbi:PRD domain-containing protein [Xenorhabdus sp. XENO-10]|uniref:PRD domain-containing protein n=1 Tax=Xenorhabdus yunnanensis TaxID=3025878 RepID=A0ABT5LD95_9GAMM|nr:PRD domain-containing protein [Xenorhabdus yunnanensis]MDC9589076.1 PRD domain-containing protein [Xenorhabdus yunnanensis]